ncbi:MAG: M16 family metallopeptidase [Candidatus Kapaibacteriales bacterium]
MTKLMVYLAILTISSSVMIASEIIDVTKKPEPLPSKDFVFPKFQEAKLENGMKVYIIEDHEQPTFSFRILIPGGSLLDKEKPGLAELTAEMLTKGAGQLSAYQIAQKLDGIGASLDISSQSDYFIIRGSCLLKHSQTLLNVLSDVLMKPTFPKEELEKLKPRIIAAIRNEKSRGSSVASALTRKIVYGENHPYGRQKTEESVKSITIEDIRNFYKKSFIPDWASLVIVGDVKEKDIVPLFNKVLKDWKKANMPSISLPPIKPSPLGVYFVERPASVQSSIVVSTPTVEIFHPDYETIDLASSIIGSGFAGRLFRTLRETYSYTYTPFGYQTSSKFANRFSCGAEVRNQVTDSAIDVIREQLRLLATEPPSEDELNRIKKVEIGSYLMSLENSEFVASLIQDAYFYGLPIERVKDYPKRIELMTPYDIQRVARQYMHPDKAYIVVVGNPEVKTKLEKFGKIFEYDLDLNPLTGEKAKLEKISLSPKELIQKYTDTRGGKQFLERVRTVVIEGNAQLSIQGQNLNGKIVEKFKHPLMKYQLVDFGVFQNQIWFNDNKGWSKGQGQVDKLEQSEIDKLFFEYSILIAFDQLIPNFHLEVLGKQGDNILVKFTNARGFESTAYFDVNTFILNKLESFENSPQGLIPITIEYKRWGKIDEFLFPVEVKTTNPMFTMEVTNNVRINQDIPDTEFIPN